MIYIDADHFGTLRAGARQLRCHVLLLDRRLVAAPTDEASMRYAINRRSMRAHR
jgi:hypothetical protein